MPGAGLGRVRGGRSRAGAYGPGRGHDVEGGLGQELAAVVAQADAADFVEALDVRTGRADAERVRVPPVLEGRVAHRDREGGVLDLVETGLVAEAGELALADPAHPGLVGDVRVEVPSCLPEGGQRGPTAGEVPHARR